MLIDYVVAKLLERALYLYLSSVADTLQYIMGASSIDTLHYTMTASSTNTLQYTMNASSTGHGAISTEKSFFRLLCMHPSTDRGQSPSY